MTTKFKNKVFEKISQQNIKTFKDLTCIINETKEECTKTIQYKDNEQKLLDNARLSQETKRTGQTVHQMEETTK